MSTSTSSHRRSDRNTNLARVIFNEASHSSRSGSLLIPFTFAVLIFGTAYLFPENFVFGISMHLTDLVSGLTALAVFGFWQLKQGVKPNKSYRGFRLWVVAGLIANLMPHIFVFAIVGEISSDFTNIGIIGLLTYPLTITLLGVLIGSWLNHRDQLRDLSQQKSQLLQMRNSLDQDIANTKKELQDLVESRLGEILAKADNDFQDLDSVGASQAASSLRDAIDQVVRPLSRQLAFESDAVDKAASDFADKDRFLEEYLAQKVPHDREQRISLSEIFLPFLFIIPTAVFAIPAMAYVEGQSGLINSAVTIGITFILLLGFKKFMGRLTSRPVTVIVFGVVAAFAITFIAGALVWQFDEQSVGPTALATCVSLIATGGEIVLYVTIRRMRNVSERQETNDAIALLVSRLRQEVWLNRRNLARIVHGRVQSKLLAASMRLSQKESPTEADFVLARADVTEAIDSLKSEIDSEGESFEVQFTRIQQAWDGVCEVALNSSGDLITKVDADSNARTCLVEIAGEAVANAAKHSKASRVDVELSETGDGYVGILITTTGELLDSGSSVSGYGSHLLDELTTQWSRSSENSVLKLTALIALDPTP